MSTVSRKEREKLARKEAIMDKAKKIFFEKGFQTTTMDQIAKAAELSKGTLYLYFPTKEELYVSILLEGIELLHDNFKKAIRGVKGWDAKLRKIGEAYYHFYRDHKNYFQILFIFHHGEIATKISDSIYQTCLDRGALCLGVLYNIIEKGISAGEIQGKNAMEIAVVLWGALTGIILIHENEDRQMITIPLENLIRTSFDILIEGLRRH